MQIHLLSSRPITFVLMLLVVVTVVGCGPRAEPLDIRVMSYNIHRGIGTDGELSLERIARIIRDQNPDLVALQEVDKGTNRSFGVDQAAELAKLTNMHHVYGPAMAYDGGEYGEAILSRWPMESSLNTALPHEKTHEPRTVLSVSIDNDNSKNPDMTFAGTHLDHTKDDTNRWMQAGALLDPGLLHSNKSSNAIATILVGDLNATPETRVIQKLYEIWTDVAGEENSTATFPGTNERIDYILVWPVDQWTVINYEVIEEMVASDHLPIVADLLLHE